MGAVQFENTCKTELRPSEKEQDSHARILQQAPVRGEMIVVDLVGNITQPQKRRATRQARRECQAREVGSGSIYGAALARRRYLRVGQQQMKQQGRSTAHMADKQQCRRARDSNCFEAGFSDHHCALDRPSPDIAHLNHNQCGTPSLQRTYPPLPPIVPASLTIAPRRHDVARRSDSTARDRTRLNVRQAIATASCCAIVPLTRRQRDCPRLTVRSSGCRGSGVASSRL